MTKDDVSPKIERRRAIFLIPNLITALALLAGFYSIVKSIDGDYTLAGWAIVVAALMDLLDGRIARWIDAQSEFGAQFDSLTDVISFGVAPAILAYQWGLVELGTFGFAAGFFFCVSVAARLARFNVTSSSDSQFFIGLPSPMAGITVATGVLVIGEQPALGNIFLLFGLMFVIAATMVSGFQYLSFKDIDVRARINSPRKLLLALVLISCAALVMLEFREMGIFVLCFLYLASGYYTSNRYIWGKLLRLRKLSQSKYIAWVHKLRGTKPVKDAEDQN